MKNSSLTAEQIVAALQQRESGESVEQICLRFEISTATFYNMRKRYAGMEVDVLKRLREREIEKCKLANTVEILKQDRSILQQILDAHGASVDLTRSCSFAPRSI